VEERPVRRWDETVREVAVRQVAGGALREVASQEREMALCRSAYSVPEACHRASPAFAKLCTAAQAALINAPSARPRAAGTPQPRPSPTGSDAIARPTRSGATGGASYTDLSGFYGKGRS